MSPLNEEYQDLRLLQHLIMIPDELSAFFQIEESYIYDQWHLHDALTGALPELIEATRNLLSPQNTRFDSRVDPIRVSHAWGNYQRRALELLATNATFHYGRAMYRRPILEWPTFLSAPDVMTSFSFHGGPVFRPALFTSNIRVKNEKEEQLHFLKPWLNKDSFDSFNLHGVSQSQQTRCLRCQRPFP